MSPFLSKTPRLIKVLPLLALVLTPSIQVSLAQNPSDDVGFTRALDWILESKMIVDNPSDLLYNNTLPPTGGIFLVFDANKSELNMRIHVPSAAEYVKLTAYLARLGHEQAVANRLKSVSDFLLASTARVNLSAGTVTVVAPIWLHKEQTGWVPIVEESYTRDILNVAQALLQAYQITRNDGYLSKSRELLNTVVLLQSLVDEKIREGELPDWTSGSLPWLMFNYEGQVNHEITFTDLDLSLTDVAWGAFTIGYNVLGDGKYLKSRDRYFEFILRSYQRDEKTPSYPYQFISERAGPLYFANFNSVDKEWGPLEPFTMDMAFYQVTGLLMNENETLKNLGKEFLQDLSLLQKGFFFDDSYYPATGEPVGYGNAIIATAQYLAALKLEHNNTAENQIRESIFLLQLFDSSDLGNKIYNGAWEWSHGSKLVESMATIITIYSIIIDPSLVPKTAARTYIDLPILIASLILATLGSALFIIILKRRRNR